MAAGGTRAFWEGVLGEDDASCDRNDIVINYERKNPLEANYAVIISQEIFER